MQLLYCELVRYYSDLAKAWYHGTAPRYATWAGSPVVQRIAVPFENCVFRNDIHTEYFAYLQCKSVKHESHYGIHSFRTETQSAVLAYIVLPRII